MNEHSDMVHKQNLETKEEILAALKDCHEQLSVLQEAEAMRQDSEASLKALAAKCDMLTKNHRLTIDVAIGQRKGQKQMVWAIVVQYHNSGIKMEMTSPNLADIEMFVASMLLHDDKDRPHPRTYPDDATPEPVYPVLHTGDHIRAYEEKYEAVLVERKDGQFETIGKMFGKGPVEAGGFRLWASHNVREYSTDGGKTWLPYGDPARFEPKQDAPPSELDDVARARDGDLA